MTKCEFMTNALAPMGTASFFGIAVESCIKMLHVVRNDKKDIALRQAQDKLPAGLSS